jgi:hypothetical protein
MNRCASEDTGESFKCLLPSPDPTSTCTFVTLALAGKHHEHQQNVEIIHSKSNIYSIKYPVSYRNWEEYTARIRDRSGTSFRIVTIHCAELASRARKGGGGSFDHPQNSKIRTFDQRIHSHAVVY